MSPPNGAGKTTPVSQPSPTPLSPAEERSELLALEQYLVDPSRTEDPQHLIKKWKTDRDYRMGHPRISELMDLVQRFLKRDSAVSETKLEGFVKEWTSDPKFKEDSINGVVLNNLRRMMGQFQTPDNKGRAEVVTAMLPPPEAPAKSPEAGPPAKNAQVWQLKDAKKHWSLGLELHNDSAPLAILDFAGLPISALATEKNHLTVRPSLEFPMGPLVGTLRLNGGFFESRGIPGEDGKPGTGYRVGADFGLVNPYSTSHERSGLGLEVTGVASHAGQQSGIEAPGPVVRLHLWRQSDFNFPLGNHFELGLNTFLNNQETYVTLGNDRALTPPGPSGDNPLATTGALFTRNPFRWFGISGRYYFNGTPERETVDDLRKPFRPGEGFPKLGYLWTGMIINLNRRQDIPALANTQVLMGTFWPLGIEASMQQFDTLATGETFFSLMDGYFLARNVQTRGEIWKRDNTWILRGLMLGTDFLMLGANIYRTAAAEGDPPANQSMEDFRKNPGSVTDFDGRAGRINLALNGIEMGLSALDASGILGDVTDKNRTRFWATSGVATGLGLAVFLFSGPLSGNGCAEDGPGGTSVLLRCGFPAQRDKYFKTGINATPDYMRSIEDQYIVSTGGAALASYGLTRLLQPLFLKEGPAVEKTGGNKEKNTALVTKPYLNVNVANGGVQVTAGGNF